MAAILLWTSVALDLGVLAGLIVRGRWREAYLLPVLILAALFSAATIGLCPRCNTWAFWLPKEFTHVTLMLLLGLELSLRAFPRASPGRRAALVWVGMVVTAAVVVVVTTPAPIDMLPRLIGAVLALYAGLTLVMAHYALTLGALHDALLYGFQFYLIVYVITWGFTGDDTTWAGILSPLAFNLMMLNLLCVAWQRGQKAQQPFALAAILRRLPAGLRELWFRHSRRN